MSADKNVTLWNGATPSLPAFSLANDVYLRPGLSTKQIWTILWAYRKLSGAIALAVFGFALIVIALLPRTYESTATLLVNYEVNDPLNDKEFPIGLLSSYLATQTEMMRNPGMLLQVVDRLNLTEDKEYRSGYFGEGASLRDYVQRKLAKNLVINQGQFGSHLIYVTASARTPERAALIANTVTDVYKDQEFTRASGPAVERAKRYAAQLTQLSAKVEQAQEQYTEFNQRNGLIDTGDGKDAVEIAVLNELEQQLANAQRARRIAESKSAITPDSDDQVVSAQHVQTIKAQLATHEGQLAELATTLGPRHPRVLELNSQIAADRNQLTQEFNGYSRNAQSSLVSAQELERKLQRAVAEQREKVLASSGLHDQAAKYRLDLESARAVYKKALDGYDQIMFASLGHYTNVDVVSRATAPVKASKPKVFVYALFALVAAVALALFFPMFYELTNRRVRTRDDFERDNGVTVLTEFHSLPLGSTT